MVSAHSPKAQLHSMHEEALAVVVVDGEGRGGGLVQPPDKVKLYMSAWNRSVEMSGHVWMCTERHIWRVNKYWSSLNIQALCLLNDVTWKRRVPLTLRKKWMPQTVRLLTS